MNFTTIKNNINQNKNMIIGTSSLIVCLITMSFYGLFNSILTIFGVIYPIYNILNIISQIIPYSSKTLKSETILSLTKWNLILVNHFVFEFIGRILFLFNIFYIQIAQIGILYLLYKFNDSINNSFENNDDSTDSSETLNNNLIITDTILIINKSRLNVINKYVSYFINITKKIDLNSDLIEMFSNYIGTKDKEIHEKEVIQEKEEEEVKESVIPGKEKSL